MITLDVKKTINNFQEAIYALQNGDSKTAEDEARAALEAIASHSYGKLKVVYYLDKPRETMGGVSVTLIQKD